MRNQFVVLFLFIAVFLQAQVAFDPDDLGTIANSERRAHAGKFNPHQQRATQGYDVSFYRCRWNVDPAVWYISGSVTTLFKPTQNAFDSMEFAMNRALTVDSVKYHDNIVPFTHTLDILTVLFPLVIPKGSIDSVTVYYKGIPPNNENGYFVQSMHNGIPIIWTLSEPYGSGDWWPCKDGLTDKADSVDVFVKTPRAYKVVSNGLLASVTPSGSSNVFHWKHRYPIATYLVCLAVTNYAEYRHLVPFGPDTLEVVNYIYPEDSLAVSLQTGVIVPLIQLYDTLFGIYPFQNEHYGHAQFGWGGGMEHQTMTFMGSFGFELQAHELAHQWFGDKVTCGSWADIWLNEGYATYLSGLAYEHLLPEWWQQFKRVRIQNIISKPGGSVWCDDTLSLDRIFDTRLSYAKGAMILNQIRWVIGDSAFFSASNNYLNDVKCSYGFALTSDLKSHFEASSGQDLTWYFDDWYTGQGFPSYRINWSQSGSELNFSISQTQSHPSVPFFKLPVPLMFKNQNRDTLIRFNNTSPGQAFSVSLPFTVDTILVDPYYCLISGNNITNAVNELLNPDAIRICPNPAGDMITVSLPFQKYGVPYIIYATDGKPVHQGILSRDQDLIDISHLKTGLYSLVLHYKDRSAAKKFIKL